MAVQVIDVLSEESIAVDVAVTSLEMEVRGTTATQGGLLLTRAILKKINACSVPVLRMQIQKQLEEQERLTTQKSRRLPSLFVSTDKVGHLSHAAQVLMYVNALTRGLCHCWTYRALPAPLPRRRAAGEAAR